jgi:hypothetical protein
VLVLLRKDFGNRSASRVYELVNGTIIRRKQQTKMVAGKIFDVSDDTGRKWIAQGIAEEVCVAGVQVKRTVEYAWRKLKPGEHPGIVVHNLGEQLIYQDDEGQTVMRLQILRQGDTRGYAQLIDRCHLEGDVPAFFDGERHAEQFLLSLAYGEINSGKSSRLSRMLRRKR